MADAFLVHDLYIPNDRKVVEPSAKPLTCFICKKELNGISITAKNIRGKTVFLCSNHYETTPQQLVSMS